MWAEQRWFRPHPFSSTPARSAPGFFIASRGFVSREAAPTSNHHRHEVSERAHARCMRPRMVQCQRKEISVTVRELIEHLKDFDPETPVMIGVGEDLAKDVYSVGAGDFFESQYGGTKLLVGPDGQLPEILPDVIDDDFEP